MAEYPQNLTFKALNKKGCHFDAKLIEVSDDFFNAGLDFPSEKYLRYRDIELSAHPIGKAVRKSRLQCSRLVPVYSELVNYVTGAVTASPLTLLATGEDTIAKTYYNGLNAAIGTGSRELLRLGMRHNEAFLAVNFEDTDLNISEMNLKTQIENGLLDGFFSCLSANDVIEYKMGKNGLLDWCKTHVTYRARSEPENIWTSEDLQVHLFTYFTKDSIIEYEYRNPIVEGKPKVITGDELVSRLPIKPHTLGVCPIFIFNPQIKIAGQILPIAIDHFNRFSSLTYHLDTGAWSMPVISDDKPIDQITGTGMAAIHLSTNGKADWMKTDSTITPQLRDNFNDIENEMYKVLNATALNLNNTMQNNSRLSAKARVHEATLLDVLLSAYATDIEQVFRKAINAIKTKREDNVDISFEGCDDYDTNSLNDQIELIKRLAETPISKTAKRYVSAGLANKLVSDAPAEVREAVIEESKGIDIEEDIINPDAQSLGVLLDKGVFSKDEVRAMCGKKGTAPVSTIEPVLNEKIVA